MNEVLEPEVYNEEEEEYDDVVIFQVRPETIGIHPSIGIVDAKFLGLHEKYHTAIGKRQRIVGGIELVADGSTGLRAAHIDSVIIVCGNINKLDWV